MGATFNAKLAVLDRLLKLAELKPEEERDEARVNEARTAALMFLKLARENGLTIRLEGPSENLQPPLAPPAPTTVHAYAEVFVNGAKVPGAGFPVTIDGVRVGFVRRR